MTDPQTNRERTRHIISVGCHEFGITESDLLTDSRVPLMVNARKAICYCLRRLVPLPTPDIAKAVGYSSHTSALRAIGEVPDSPTLLKPCNRIIEQAQQDFRHSPQTLGEAPSPDPRPAPIGTQTQIDDLHSKSVHLQAQIKELKQEIRDLKSELPDQTEPALT